ncbi:MAG: MarR family winged helix-turn-helix transcriptional regulator [Solirubrobacteraceae bacterium]
MRRGIVLRSPSPSPDDRRGVTVTLTAEGRDVLGRQHAWVRARQLTFHDGLSPGERDVVAGLLVRLAGLVDELSAGPAD